MSEPWYRVQWHPLFPFYARYEVVSGASTLIKGSRWGFYPRERATKAAIQFCIDNMWGME